MAEQEKLPTSPETAVENNEAAGERLEHLMKKAELSPETSAESQEKNAEDAKEKAFEAIGNKEKSEAEKDKQKTTSSPRRHGVVSKKEKEQSFKRHMESVQRQLPTRERIFSKFIHNKTVEKTSEVVGNTLARPNAILYGGIFAFVLVAVVYGLAKYFGYVLSGFETIGAFIVGWVLGIVYDYIRLLIVGRR